ncbi:unnamed protein product [Protopolystoma xenopodis]|uniref:Uncharacterized protein n=1 Tax=Protopolystoma xenopodis TaxID=117903 RepID=A0A448XD88_9PLAT|nr:unnamed protein product [Protopolystoma xenopodis]
MGQRHSISVEWTLADHLFTLTREIVRELFNNPVAINSIIQHQKQWGIHPSMGSRHLVGLVIQLRGLTRDELMTTPKARARREEYLAKVARRDSEQKKIMLELVDKLNALSKRQKELETRDAGCHNGWTENWLLLVTLINCSTVLKMSTLTNDACERSGDIPSLRPDSRNHEYYGIG